MRNIIYLLIIFILFSCQSQNKKPDSEKKSNKEYAKSKVLFSAYTTAEKGLNYRKKPNVNSEILGKFKYGSKVSIVDNANYPLFDVEDSERGSLTGKWVGIKKDTSIVYVFDAYLFKSSTNNEKHINLTDGKLELIYKEKINIDSNLNMIIEMHIQTSNHLADYSLINLETKKEIVFTHKIEYLFKEGYELKKAKDTNSTYEYFTVFDECPSRDYKQKFEVKGYKILKINEEYNETDEEEYN